MEATHRSELAKGIYGIKKRKPAPLFSEFAKRFIEYVGELFQFVSLLTHAYNKLTN